MLKLLLRRTCGGLLLLAAMLSAPAVLRAQTVSAVPELDLSRYTGMWYEVAYFPNKSEKRCASNNFQLLSLADKPRHFLLVTSCRTEKGNLHVRNATGKAANKANDGRFKISYVWPFSNKYWVLAIAPGYEWALVGSPNRKTLWVLSRTATMAPSQLAEIKTVAAAQGFDTSKLVSISQARAITRRE